MIVVGHINQFAHPCSVVFSSSMQKKKYFVQKLFRVGQNVYGMNWTKCTVIWCYGNIVFVCNGSGGY
jgi:hypothetical protein